MMCLLALSVLSSKGAFAHGAFKGIGNFYGGVLHPVVVPAHLLALIAAGLFVGRQGWTRVVRLLPMFMVACAIGLVLSSPSVETVAGIGLLAGAAAIGLLVAIDVELPDAIGTVLVIAIGFTIALDSAPGTRFDSSWFVALAGTGIGLSANLVWLSAPLTRLAKPWQRIGIRVAGSWISACALLVLALVASGKAPLAT